MVLVSGEAAILGLSIVEVSGAATIRDDISMTARRTALDKIFQTKLFRRSGDSHAHARARARAPPMLPRHPTPMLPSWAPTLSNPMDGVADVQLASSMLGEYFSIATWTLTLSTLKGRGARLGANGGLCECACACVCVCVCARVCVCVCVAVASEKFCRGLSVLQSVKCHHEWPRQRSQLRGS